MSGLYRFLPMVALVGIIGVSPAIETAAVAAAAQSHITPPPKPEKGFPSVVIYTLSTCPHCAAAKEYLTKKGIPFTNREVDTDDGNMEELVRIYDEMKVPEASRGVPFFIIGGTTRLQGFSQEQLDKALKDAAGK